jgi:hypothetical protein
MLKRMVYVVATVLEVVTISEGRGKSLFFRNVILLPPAVRLSYEGVTDALLLVPTAPAYYVQFNNLRSPRGNASHYLFSALLQGGGAFM